MWNPSLNVCQLPLLVSSLEIYGRQTQTWEKKNTIATSLTVLITNNSATCTWILLPLWNLSSNVFVGEWVLQDTWIRHLLVFVKHPYNFCGVWFEKVSCVAAVWLFVTNCASCCSFMNRWKALHHATFPFCHSPFSRKNKMQLCIMCHGPAMSGLLLT